MKQKTRNKLIFKKLKVRLFEIKLKQKVMQDPQTIDNLSKKKKKKLAFNWMPNTFKDQTFIM